MFIGLLIFLLTFNAMFIRDADALI